jgi:hypothetical protein
MVTRTKMARMRARRSFASTAALATAAATALGCTNTVTQVANEPGLHRATEIGFMPTEGPPLTHPRQIRFAADRPDVTLLRLDDAGWSGYRAMVGRDIVPEPAYRLVPVCVSPCEADVQPATWYAVGGNDVARTRAFQMHDDATTVRVKSGGSQTLREIGLGVGLVSLFVCFLGGVGILTSDPHNDPTGHTAATDTLAVGAGTLAAGITLWLLNPPTRVEFEQ